jgi:hypothetical protein
MVKKNKAGKDVGLKMKLVEFTDIILQCPSCGQSMVIVRVDRPSKKKVKHNGTC